MSKGNIGVTSDNIFPVIKKFLYSDHEIFLRELVSNAVDATQKLKTLASVGEFKGELGDLSVRVSVDNKKGTITISDRGVGMTAEEIEKYINQIAFSGAEEFVEKYKNDAQSIIGHFGLGFYSSFMVSKKVEIFTQSFKDNTTAQHWSCKGDPEYSLEDSIKADRGTDIVLHIDDDNKDFLEESKIKDLLTKYCKFLPVEIVFGKVKEWKDGKEVETEKDLVINNTSPAWTKKPADLTDEDYNNFYRELYPMSEEPLFHIHLNVDYPFNLTGILYFPKIKNNIEMQRNKIQLYCNQVFVTDHVENIVPDYLTLLHGVIDSPDIPLNVSRSYLQSDANVKKISGHITKKVADRLTEIFKADRKQYEDKWDNLKIFIQYGMLSDEKFYEKGEKFALLKNVDGQYFTFEEYKELVKESQKDKNGDVIYLYTSNKEEQYSYIQHAKDKGYDVLTMDGQLDVHVVSQLEQKLEKTRFVRVDSDTVDKLIQKDETPQVTLSVEQRDALVSIFKSQIPAVEKAEFIVTFEQLSPNVNPVFVTQNEFMRRMKEMSALQGGMMSFYGEMPDSYNLVVNTGHPLIDKLLKEEEAACADEINPVVAEIQLVEAQINTLQESEKNKKDEKSAQASNSSDENAALAENDKVALDELRSKVDTLKSSKEKVYEAYAVGNKQVRQLVDLALLSNNMLKGEALANFVKRSVEFI